MRTSINVRMETLSGMRTAVPDMSDDKRIEFLTSYYKNANDPRDKEMLNKILEVIELVRLRL